MLIGRALPTTTQNIKRRLNVYHERNCACMVSFQSVFSFDCQDHEDPEDTFKSVALLLMMTSDKSARDLEDTFYR